MNTYLVTVYFNTEWDEKTVFDKYLVKSSSGEIAISKVRSLYITKTYDAITYKLINLGNEPLPVSIGHS